MCSLQDHQGRLRIFQAHCGNLFSISFCGISVCSLTSAGSTASGSHHVKFPFRFATKILIVFDNLSGVFCRRLLRRGRATESGRAQGKREGPCVPWSNSAAPPPDSVIFLEVLLLSVPYAFGHFPDSEMIDFTCFIWYFVYL